MAGVHADSDQALAGGTVGAKVYAVKLQGGKVTGTVKKITEKGYGFLTAADGTEVFFHYTELRGVKLSELREGDSVEFNVVKGDRGLRATGVTRSGTTGAAAKK
jgi:cold shock protein